MQENKQNKSEKDSPFEEPKQSLEENTKGLKIAKGTLLEQAEKGVKEIGFIEKMKTHRFWLVRILFYIVYSVWLIVAFIGMIIAWIFTWILL